MKAEPVAELSKFSLHGVAIAAHCVKTFKLLTVIEESVEEQIVVT